MKRRIFFLKKYNSFDVFGKIKYGNLNYNEAAYKIFLKRYSSSFDVFDKIKDTNNSNKDETQSELKRKPTKKVLKLVDEILNLTLIEAADLCDLCQEKLEGNKTFNNSSLINRNPFPHPSNFFGAGNFSPYNQTNVSSSNHVINNNEISTENAKKGEEKTEKKLVEKKVTKSTYNIKLEKFDVKNKINTIKEIRKITNVGLKEAKDMVESAPFYIQKNVPVEKADEIKKKFEELGSTIILE